MAARSSGSGGITILAVVSLVFAVGFAASTLVMFLKWSNNDQELSRRDEADREFITTAERNSDEVRRIRGAAKGDSVVGYLMATNDEAMRLSVGSGSIDDLRKLFKRDDDRNRPARIQSTSLLRAVDQLDSQVSGLEQRLAAAEQAAEVARTDRRAEVDRVKAIEESMRQALASAQDDLARYREEVDSNSDDVADARQFMDGQVEQARNEARDREAELNGEISKLERELLLATDTAKRLQEELRGQRYEGEAEEALVDGRVIGIDSDGAGVFVNIGRRQKAVLGMTFELYSDPSAMRPDPKTGEYPEGKASIELIEVSDSSSKGRVLRQKRGDPIVKDDVIANAVYDPNKVYTALVYGNFDTNGDGRYTEQEQRDIRARIEEWGGRVTDELTGSVDFLVLGRRPEPGPPPQINAPIVVMEEHMRKTRIAKRFDELFEQAIATSIPVLNENRLETLTGGISSR